VSKYGDIRFLVESYYDVQKLRVETFNRIVAYVKSHKKHETQDDCASQGVIETQSRHASRGPTETHFFRAGKDENQAAFAVGAGRKKYALLAHKIVKEHSNTGEISDLVWYHKSLLETEKQLAKRLDLWSRKHPLRINFLNRIQGIGPILSSGIIAWFNPISRFNTISALWKYCGLAPGQQRRKGEKSGFNVRLKTFCWKIATSFEKQKPEKNYYRRIYDNKKAYYMERPDLKEKIKANEKGIVGHIRNMALRYTVKRFLCDMWVFWRQMEGLPVTKPYVFDVLGHVDYEEWQPDK